MQMGSKLKADSPRSRSRSGYSEITDTDAGDDESRSWTDYSEQSDAGMDNNGVASLPSPRPKDPRSKAKYNIFSRLFFIWLEPLFFLGCRKELKQGDLYVHPSETDSEKLLRHFNKFWDKELERKKCGQKARLWLAVAKCFWWRLILQGISILLEVAILVAQSIMLGDLSEYFGIVEPTGEDTRNAYLYAMGLIVMTLTVVVLHSHSFLMGQKMSMITRIITTAAIYQKVLSLNQVCVGQVSVGHVVNLASNDVQRFEPAFPHLPYLWVTPLHLIVFTSIVYQEVGWSVFIAAGFVLLQIPLQIGLARLFVHLRLKSALVTDERIRIMSEIISGIRVIKMYTWEYAFEKNVSQLRKKESLIIFKGALIRACNLAYMIVSISIIMWLTLTVHVSAGGELSTKQVFTTLSLLTALRLSSYFFVLAILGISEGKVAFSRIQHLLELEDSSTHKELGLSNYTDEFEETGSVHLNGTIIHNESFQEEQVLQQKEMVCFGSSTPSLKTNGSIGDCRCLIRVHNLSASWSFEQERAVFFDINFEVNKSIPLLAIVGPVGTGKSTLLQCLLGELKPLEGLLEVIGRISYSSQEPWVFTGTLRDNILFGMPFLPERYNSVIEACSLDEDILELANGDLTEIGERGVTLSGGQKARVNLARAIYRDADIYILDDPLSAVDVSVATHLFNNVIRDLLRDRLVVLVTHQLQFALQADKILVIKEGYQEVYGSHEELLDQGIDPNYLLGLIRDEDELDEEEREMFAYKLIYDAEPPSPTTLSLLSLIDETGRITPYSFGLERPGSISTDGHASVTSSLALYGRSMHDISGSSFEQLHKGESINSLNFAPLLERLQSSNSTENVYPPTPFILPHVRDQQSSPTEFPKCAEQEELLPKIPVVSSVAKSTQNRLSPPGFPFPGKPPNISSAMKGSPCVRDQQSSPTEFPKSTRQEELPPKIPIPSIVKSSQNRGLSPPGFPFPRKPLSSGTKGLSPFVPRQCSPIPGSPVMLNRKQTGRELNVSGLTQVPGKNKGHPLLSHNLADHAVSTDSKLRRPTELEVSQIRANGAPRVSPLASKSSSPPLQSLPNDRAPAANPLVLCIPPTPPLTLANKAQSRANSTISTPQVTCNPATPPLAYANASASSSQNQSSLKTKASPLTNRVSPLANNGQDKQDPFDCPVIECIPPTPPITIQRDERTLNSPSSPTPQLHLDDNQSFRSPSRRTYASSLCLSPGLPRSGLSSPLASRRRRRSPTPSPIMMKRTHQDEDHLHTANIEPGRFDAASIYSGKSMVSLPGSLHSVIQENKRLSTEPQAQKEKESDDSQSGKSEEKGSGTISLKTYYSFFRAGGSFVLLLTVLIVFLLGEVSVVLSDWWLSDWADCSTLLDQATNNDTFRPTCSLSSAQRIGIYTFTTLTAIILNFTRAILFYFLCLNASHILHNRMFAAVLNSPMLFFDNNPAGRVLNRFSKDVGYLDDLLPYTFCEYLLLLLRCLAVIIMAVVSNVWLIIPASLLIATFLTLRWYYLKTSRDVKRLEAVARSPLFSHISTTLFGLSTIRAFGKEQMSIEQFHEHQNAHSQAWYLYLVTVRWFGLRIDLLSAIFLATVALLSVPLASQLNAGLVGLGLTYTISLADMLQYTIRLSADVENTMVSAERIMEYSKLECEGSHNTLGMNEKPPSDWPDKGKITFEDVSFRYALGQPLVVKNLCVTIEPSEKVGIVGRTGAGKSSLISVLYRLAEPFGLITIDGVDTKSIGLHDLRKKMSIIPQDPVLFSGSMRYNLDPFDEYSDAELWEALEQAELKPVVQQLEGQLGAEVSEGGSNFSVGQRQLVCLARALLRKNKILVLDEATANVDQRTDEVIQKAIRDNFAECTVLTIAHRLNTIMDSDKIMVLKKGKLKEFDSPYKLLQDSVSRFYKMVEKTGPVASGKLHQMALEAHLRKTFRKHGRITPLLSKLSGKSLQTRSLLQRTKGLLPVFNKPGFGGLSRIQERRPSIISSNSFPSALNEIGLGNPVNMNDPNLQSLRLPSDPNVAATGDDDEDWNDSNN